MLQCKPSVCPSVQAIMFMPPKRFDTDYYAILAQASKTKGAIAEFIQKRLFGRPIVVQSASAAVRGETATVSLHFVYKEGTYRYNAYGKF
jgi:hypothetical protein